jgi:hypothetical protein
MDSVLLVVELAAAGVGGVPGSFARWLKPA